METATQALTLGSTKLEKGWTQELPMGDYLADEAISASELWGFSQVTPSHFREARRKQETREDSSHAMDLGHLTHTAVFESSEFERRYVTTGQCEAITKTTGVQCDAQGSRYRDGSSYCGRKGHDPYGDDPMEAGLYIVPQSSKDNALAMKKALLAHPTAGQLLTLPGSREVTGVAQDPKTGLWLRTRPDLLTPGDGDDTGWAAWSVTNLKVTTKSAAPDEFIRDAFRMGHYFRAAFYRLVVSELWDVEPQNFFYPIVESAAPNEVIVYRMNDDALDIGEGEVRRALNELAQCVEADEWPGYGKAVHDLSLPAWRMKQVHAIDFQEVDG